jgi:DNA-binding transcriptional LysR family regulator
MVPVGHPLAAANSVSLRRIARYPLILPPKSGKDHGRERLEDLLQQRGLDYHVIMESSNVELSSLYVEIGLGVSFATMVSGLNLLPARRVSFLPLKRYFKEDYLAVVMRKDKVLSSYKRAFLEGLLEHFPFSEENVGKK